MPALSNPRWERFANELAFGKHSSHGAAYIAAGYDCNDKASEVGAARLLKKASEISIRVRELMDAAAEASIVSVASITENLKRIGRKAEALGEASGLSVARQVEKDIAQLHGLAVVRVETGDPGDFARLADEDLQTEVATMASELGLKPPGATAH